MPPKLPCLWRDLGPQLVPLAHLSPYPKRHVDQFSRFSTATAHSCDQQSDRLTDHATSVIMGRILYYGMRHNYKVVAKLCCQLWMLCGHVPMSMTSCLVDCSVSSRILRMCSVKTWTVPRATDSSHWFDMFSGTSADINTDKLINGDGDVNGSSLPVDSQSKLFDLLWGWWPLGAQLAWTGWTLTMA